MVGFLRASKNFVLDLLFPIECLGGCGTQETYLCAACFAKVPIKESFECPVCRRPSFEDQVCANCPKKYPLSGVIAATFYEEGPVRNIILGLKYKFIKPLAENAASILLKKLAVHDHSLFRRSDLVLVPVPISAQRYNWRGFNQADEITRVLAQKLGEEFVGDALSRPKNTRAQADQESRQDRLSNVRGAFQCHKADKIKNRTVVLVDDVATTLATLAECAKVLKKMGAREVWGLVVAREN
jgi:ComF family protein